MSTYRQLLDSATYSPFISSPDLTTTELGDGDTYLSIKLLKDWTLEHYNQVEKLAPKLKGRTLADTVKNVKYWVYYSIQYKKDGAIQILRSPARAWMDRHIGSDCKTYSILVSSILLNLGIKHYFRKIKQVTRNPDEFSHVYVVVPKNQKTGKLNKGHYTIDSTIYQMEEPIYSQKHDLYMTHIGLNGVDSPENIPLYEAEIVDGLNCACQRGLYGNDDTTPTLPGYDWNNLTTQIGSVFGSSIKGIFDTKNAKYTSRANEIAAHAKLAAEKAKADAAALQSQTALIAAQADKDKAAQAAALERLKIESEQKKQAGNRTLVIAGIATGAVLLTGAIFMITRKKSKAA